MYVREGSLSDKQGQHGTDIIVMSSIGLGHQWNYKVYLEKKYFEKTMSIFHFPKQFAEALRGNNGAFASFLDYEEVEGTTTPTFLCKCAHPDISRILPMITYLLNPDIISPPAIIIQSPRYKVSNISFVMRIRIEDLSSVSLAFCETQAGAHRLLSRLAEHRSRLQQNPLNVLNLFYQEHGRLLEEGRKHVDDEVVAIEKSTGMTSLPVHAPEDTEKDLAKLTKALHKANTNLIFFDNVANFDVALGKSIKEIFVKLEGVRQTRNLIPTPANVSQVLHQNIDYLIILSECRKYQAQSLHRRVQSQINVVSKTSLAGKFGSLERG